MALYAKTFSLVLHRDTCAIHHTMHEKDTAFFGSFHRMSRQIVRFSELFSTIFPEV